MGNQKLYQYDITSLQKNDQLHTLLNVWNKIIERDIVENTQEQELKNEANLDKLLKLASLHEDILFAIKKNMFTSNIKGIFDLNTNLIKAKLEIYLNAIKTSWLYWKSVSLNVDTSILTGEVRTKLSDYTCNKFSLLVQFIAQLIPQRLEDLMLSDKNNQYGGIIFRSNHIGKIKAIPVVFAKLVPHHAPLLRKIFIGKDCRYQMFNNSRTMTLLFHLQKSYRVQQKTQLDNIEKILSHELLEEATHFYELMNKEIEHIELWKNKLSKIFHKKTIYMLNDWLTILQHKNDSYLNEILLLLENMIENLAKKNVITEECALKIRCYIFELDRFFIGNSLYHGKYIDKITVINQILLNLISTKQNIYNAKMSNNSLDCENNDKSINNKDIIKILFNLIDDIANLYSKKTVEEKFITEKINGFTIQLNKLNNNCLYIRKVMIDILLLIYLKNSSEKFDDTKSSDNINTKIESLIIKYGDSLNCQIVNDIVKMKNSVEIKLKNHVIPDIVKTHYKGFKNAFEKRLKSIDEMLYQGVILQTKKHKINLGEKISINNDNNESLSELFARQQLFINKIKKIFALNNFSLLKNSTYNFFKLLPKSTVIQNEFNIRTKNNYA